MAKLDEPNTDPGKRIFISLLRRDSGAAPGVRQHMVS
jgi:hypothetical protein